jgi:hypothetical protein
MTIFYSLILLEKCLDEFLIRFACVIQSQIVLYQGMYWHDQTQTIKGIQIIQIFDKLSTCDNPICICVQLYQELKNSAKIKRIIKKTSKTKKRYELSFYFENNLFLIENLKNKFKEIEILKFISDIFEELLKNFEKNKELALLNAQFDYY